MRPLCALLLLAVSVSGARAQECAPQDEGEVVTAHRLLRQLTLDLLGRIPTMDEWSRLEAGTDIDAELLPEMLASDAYFARVRDDHRALLWGSLGNLGELASVTGQLRFAGTGVSTRAYLPNNARRYRGAPGVTCDDIPHPGDAYDADGHPLPMRYLSVAEQPSCTVGSGASVEGCRIEGTVMVAPWWDPAASIKVCAYDAQTSAFGRNTGACEAFNPDPECGCGENLRHCMPDEGRLGQREVRNALEQEPLRIVEAVVREGRSYLEVFTSQETYVNGASSHYYRHLAGAVRPTVTGQVSFDPNLGELPDVAFDADWQRIERPREHSGVLTTAAYLLRFASHRARANRFYSAFRCEPFVPSSEGLPEEVEANPHPNLRERDGCRTCHQTLEPIAAHWGRWRTDSTFGYLSNALLPLSAPSADHRCADFGVETCGDSGNVELCRFCNAYFVTAGNSDERARVDYAGLPRVRAWLTPDEALAIDEGPRALLDEESERRAVARCTATTVAERLLGRDLSRRERVGWVPELRTRFEASGFDYSALVLDVVRGERYRATR